MNQSEIIALLVPYCVIVSAVGLLCHWLARAVFHGSTDGDGEGF